jgi:molybdenum cofactor cytidylyltransferase
LQRGGARVNPEAKPLLQTDTRRVMDIDGIILAAGLARRMGTNKLRLRYNGRTLLEHAVSLALKLPLASVTLVSREETLTGLYIPHRIRVVLNPEPEKGISQSLRLGLEHVSGDGFLFFQADQPLLRAATVRDLLVTADAETIIVPEHGGVPGGPVLYPAKFKDELLSLRGDAGGRAVRDRHPEACRYVSVADAGELRDIDTQEDYERLISRPGGEPYASA